MNPDCTLTVMSEESISKDFEKTLTQFTVVTVANQTMKFQSQLSSLCHKLKIPYFYCRSVGKYAYAFSDCLEHKYQTKISGENKHKGTILQSHTDIWCSYSEFLTAPNKIRPKRSEKMAVKFFILYKHSKM
eukprot:UN24143